ncbi:MAG: ABC transporter permease [Clostridiaceae bacterium]
MKPYLESVRRLSRTGLVLLVLTVVGSIVISMQICIPTYQDQLPSLGKMFTPLMVFTFVGGVVLAFDGFSFLTRRADSDYYHSLPVSRKNLFWAITLAALTWIAATVLASSLITTVVYTVTKTVFVPLYPLVAVPFYIVSTMLVFAAAAMACSLSGTMLTNLAITAVILFLPRFVQFSIARGVIDKALLLSWFDLPWYLNPTTNIATGQLVLLSRSMLKNEIFSYVNVGYSLALAVGELFLADLCFVRRHSEVAEHGAKNAKVQTLYACLLTLPIVLLFSSGVLTSTWQNILLAFGVALGCYIIYQVVVFRNAKKVIRSLPWYLIPALFAVCLFFGVQVAGMKVRNEVPQRSEIAYVTFPGSDRASDLRGYASLLVANVHFTDPELIDYAYVVLKDNIESVNLYGYFNTDADPLGTSYVISEPVTFVLNNGTSISRILVFTNGNMLNSMRSENEEYSEAIRALPPADSVRSRQGVDVYDAKYAKSESVMSMYYQETAEKSLIPYDEYRQHTVETSYYSQNDQQSYGDLNIQGYVGMTRYYNYYNINLETPKTCSEWMRMQNADSTDEHLDLLYEISKASADFLDSNDSLDCSFTLYNIPVSSGKLQSMSFYFNRYAGDTSNTSSQYTDLAIELTKLLLKSEPTTDPNSLCVYMQWSGRAMGEDQKYIGADVMTYPMSTYGNSFGTYGDVVYTSDGTAMYVSKTGSIYSYSPCYRTFAAEDEARVLEILEQWRILNRTYSYGGVNDMEEDDTIGGVLTPIPTPTVAPAN